MIERQIIISGAQDKKLGFGRKPHIFSMSQTPVFVLTSLSMLSRSAVRNIKSLEFPGNTDCEFKIQIGNKLPQEEYVVIYTLLENKRVYARNK